MYNYYVISMECCVYLFSSQTLVWARAGAALCTGTMLALGTGTMMAFCTEICFKVYCYDCLARIFLVYSQK